MKWALRLLAAVGVGLAVMMCSPWGAIEIGDGEHHAVVTFVSAQPVQRVLYRRFGAPSAGEYEYLASAEWEELLGHVTRYHSSISWSAGRYPVMTTFTTRRSAATGITFRYTQVDILIVAELENGERWLFLPQLPDLRTQRELTLRIPADGRLLQGGFAKLPLTRDDAPLPPQRGDRK